MKKTGTLEISRTLIRAKSKIDTIQRMLNCIGWLFDIGETEAKVLSYIILMADGDTEVLELSDSCINEITDKANITKVKLKDIIKSLCDKGVIKLYNNRIIKIEENLLIKGLRDDTKMQILLRFTPCNIE